MYNFDWKRSRSEGKVPKAVRNRIKKQLQRCFCLACGAEGQETTANAGQLLQDVHSYASSIPGGLSYLLFCIHVLLGRMCEKSLGKGLWSNCVRTVVDVSLIAFHKEHPELLYYLLYFCQETSQLSLSASVRAEALRGIAEVQQDSDAAKLELCFNHVVYKPFVVIVAHLQDVSEECRMAAIESLYLESDSNIRALVSHALTERDENIRRYCLFRLAKNVTIYSLTLNERVSLLKCLFSSGLTHSEVCFELLKSWMISASRAYIGGCEETRLLKAGPSEMLGLLDILNEEEITRNAIFLSLICCKDNLGMENAKCFDFLKEIVYNGSEWVVNAYSYKNLLNRTISSTKLVVVASYLRYLAGFCKLQCRDSGDWSRCHHLLLPTMRTFCDFLKRFVISCSSKDMAEDDIKNNNFALIQLLTLIPLYDGDDVPGRRAWRELLEFILVKYQIGFSQKLIDYVVKTLYEHFWPTMNDDDDAISFICDVTSSIVHHSYNPYATLLGSNETIALNASNTSAFLEASTIQVDEKALLRCVTIVNSMMRTSRHRKMNSLISGLLENVIEKGLISEIPDCRSLAFETMGIMGVFDKEFARQRTVLVKDTLELVDSLKMSALNVLGNFCLVYGFDDVSKWFRGISDFGDPSNSLLQAFHNHIWETEASASYVACKCLCQLILTRNIRNHKWTLCQLLMKLFHSDTDDWTRSCINCFLDCYSSSAWENQLALVGCFKEIFDAEVETGSPSTLNIDKSEVASRIIAATRLATLKHAADEVVISAHTVLCELLLEMMLTGSDYDNEVLSDCLCNLDVEVWGDTVFMRHLLERMDDIKSDFEDYRKVYRALQNFCNKIEARISLLWGSTGRSNDFGSPNTVLHSLINSLYLGITLGREPDEEVTDLVNRTACLALQRPLTRSASKKLDLEDKFQKLQVEEHSSAAENDQNVRNLRSENLAFRRSRRRLDYASVWNNASGLLTPVAEENVERSP
ncbi:unnamed protein product [Enterobius vermicularis]|uniref:Cnd3 domain-containing protein n=1 Tax=Enterobius vermicularis TaxID=51028 RepID=A0A0N4UUK9_ENTVE|nr:unnamed protein product [Enterobius vermicularis]